MSQTANSLCVASISDDELVLYDQRGYYAATPEGARFVYLKFPGLPGYNSFQQFARVLEQTRSCPGDAGGKGRYRRPAFNAAADE